MIDTYWNVGDVRSPEEFEDTHILGAIQLPPPNLRPEADTALDRSAKHIIACRSGECSMVVDVPAPLPTQADRECGGFTYRVHGMSDPKQEHQNAPDPMLFVINPSQRICRNPSPGLDVHRDAANPASTECFTAEEFVGSFGLLNMTGRDCYLGSNPSHRYDICRTTSSTPRINQPTDDNPQPIPGEP